MNKIIRKNIQEIVMLKKKIHGVWKVLSFAFFCCLFPACGQTTDKKLEIATFAGGCFWCVQHDFNQIDEVVSTTVGYTGGIN